MPTANELWEHWRCSSSLEKVLGQSSPLAAFSATDFAWLEFPRCNYYQCCHLTGVRVLGPPIVMMLYSLTSRRKFQSQNKLSVGCSGT